MPRRVLGIILTLCALKLALCGAGCALSDAPAPPIKTTQPFYWTTQPAIVDVTHPDFNKLWNASAQAARDFGYAIDRQDFRNGLITTEPLTGQQFFEPWRHDTGDTAGLANNSITTFRRTIRMEFERTEDGQFKMSPCVLVERTAQAEQPISSDGYLRSSMTPAKHSMLGTRETDRAVYLPKSYWYATGRDHALERDIAKAVQKKLRS